MNICFLAYDYPSAIGGGGVGNQVRVLGRALVQGGHSVTVIDLARPGLPAVQDDEGVRVHRVQPGVLHWYASKLPGMGPLIALALRELEYAWVGYRMVRRLHQQNSFDVIEGTETGALIVALGLRDVPLVIRLHGETYTFHKYTPGLSLTPGLRLSRMLQRAALRRARVLISPSQAHASEISAELRKRHPPIEVIPNCVDLERLPSLRGVERDPTMVLYVGRLERVKGVLLLLEAAGRVVQRLPNIHFVLAGASHPTVSQMEIDTLVDLHGLQDNVQMLGHVPWEKLLHLYQRAAVCVRPSYYETFGLAAIEPMAFRVPVIVTAAGALPEVVEDGVTGVLVAVNDAESLASSITSLLESETWRTQLSEAAYRKLLSQWSISRLLEPNLRVFEQLINTDIRYSTATLDARCMKMNYIVFSSHLDDAVLSCGGRIAQLKRQGAAVQVVTVFSGIPNPYLDSAFVDHLHKKWQLSEQVVEQRRREDRSALAVLGVEQVHHWDYLEAPYRMDSAGSFMYASYDELSGDLHPTDQSLIALILKKIQAMVGNPVQDTQIYFPLSVGSHVDHQLLYRVGLQMHRLGHDVWFYEEWPYAEDAVTIPDWPNWEPDPVDIRLPLKVAAAQKYTSQSYGLGGTPERLTQRMTSYALFVGGGTPQERIWKLTGELSESAPTPAPPLASPEKKPGLGDFRRFLKTFTWPSLDEVLPPGGGICVDLGCGQGRHRELIQDRGYRWLALDIEDRGNSLHVLADGENLPISANCVNAVVAWQMMEYIVHPDQIVVEACRILKPGGVFCGSVSHLEPMHGRTFYNLSPLAIDVLLRQAGFVDIAIQPGLNGFALMLWTWLRRWGGDVTARAALPLTAGWLVPMAGGHFFVSWLRSLFQQGHGHHMRWVSDVAPLQFAGHVMFSARKPANRPCTSAL